MRRQSRSTRRTRPPERWGGERVVVGERYFGVRKNRWVTWIEQKWGGERWVVCAEGRVHGGSGAVARGKGEMGWVERGLRGEMRGGVSRTPVGKGRVGRGVVVCGVKLARAVSPPAQVPTAGRTP